MNVRELMTSPVESIDEHATIADAARRLRDANVGILPVMSGGELVGVVTDRDLVVRVLAEDRDPAITTVGEVRTPGVATCEEDTDVADAAAIMVRKAIRRLVVLDADGRVSGVVSVDDLAVTAADEGAPQVLGTAEPVYPLTD